MSERKKLFENYEEIPINLIQKASWNYKEENESLSEKLQTNLKKNGQVENIIVRELEGGGLEVLNGNHRIDAMKAVGFETVVACNKGMISDTEAQRIAIETNETSFPTDMVKISSLAMELANPFDIEDLLQTLPYNKHDFEGFGILSKFDWNESVKKEESDRAKKKVVGCPNCGKSVELD